ncbi:MAG: hypothetical protein U1F16_15490 [Turneriella sp.]
MFLTFTARKRTVLLCTCAVLAAAGCLSMEKKIFSPGCAEPRRTWPQISVSYALPEEKHRYLGEIVIQYGSGYERAEIIRRLKVEAAECGADGLLLGSFSRVDSKWKWADKNMNDSFDTSGYRLIATMFRYEDTPPR